MWRGEWEILFPCCSFSGFLCSFLTSDHRNIRYFASFKKFATYLAMKHFESCNKSQIFQQSSPKIERNKSLKFVKQMWAKLCHIHDILPNIARWVESQYFDKLFAFLSQFKTITNKQSNLPKVLNLFLFSLRTAVPFDCLVSLWLSYDLSLNKYLIYFFELSLQH